MKIIRLFKNLFKSKTEILLDKLFEDALAELPTRVVKEGPELGVSKIMAPKFIELISNLTVEVYLNSDHPFLQVFEAAGFMNYITNEIHLQKSEMFESHSVMMSVLFHEIGHATGDMMNLSRNRPEKLFKDEEIIAEGFAYLMSSYYGVNDALSDNKTQLIMRHYIRRLKWGKDRAKAEILKAVDYFLKGEMLYDRSKKDMLKVA